MSAARTLMFKVLVKPYYRQNSSLFLYLVILMFSFSSLVSQYPLQYHYRLILGMLMVREVLLLVFMAWLIYLLQCARFAIFLLQDPRYTFLNTLCLAGGSRAYWLLLLVQLWLSLPITTYALAAAGVAVYQSWYGMAILIPGFILSLCLFNAWCCLYCLRHPGRPFPSWIKIPRFDVVPYWSFFVRYILYTRKSLFIGVKVFSCCCLFFLLKDLGPDDYDLRMPTLFFSFGIFAHGVIIYRFRELESTRLLFYRGLPVSLSRRYLQYGLLYFLLFVPEILIIIELARHSLHPGDAAGLAIYGYSLLLLLNSLLFVGAFRMGAYLRVIFAIFLLQYAFVLGGGLAWLSGVFFVAAAVLFRWGYYRSFTFNMPRSVTLGW